MTVDFVAPIRSDYVAPTNADKMLQMRDIGFANDQERQAFVALLNVMGGANISIGTDDPTGGAEGYVHLQINEFSKVVDIWYRGNSGWVEYGVSVGAAPREFLDGLSRIDPGTSSIIAPSAVFDGNTQNESGISRFIIGSVNVPAGQDFDLSHFTSFPINANLSAYDPPDNSNGPLSMFNLAFRAHGGLATLDSRHELRIIQITPAGAYDAQSWPFEDAYGAAQFRHAGNGVWVLDRTGTGSGYTQIAVPNGDFLRGIVEEVEFRQSDLRLHASQITDLPAQEENRERNWSNDETIAAERKLSQLALEDVSKTAAAVADVKWGTPDDSFETIVERAASTRYTVAGTRSPVRFAVELPGDKAADKLETLRLEIGTVENDAFTPSTTNAAVSLTSLIRGVRANEAGTVYLLFQSEATYAIGTILRVWNTGTGERLALTPAARDAIKAALDALIDVSSRNPDAPDSWNWSFDADQDALLGTEQTRTVRDADFLTVVLTDEEDRRRQGGETYRIRITAESRYTARGFQPRVTLGGKTVEPFDDDVNLEFPVTGQTTEIAAVVSFRGYSASGTLTVRTVTVTGVGTHEAEFESFTDARVHLLLDSETAERQAGDRQLSGRIDTTNAAVNSARTRLDGLDAGQATQDTEIDNLGGRVGDLESGRQNSQGVIDHLSLADTGALEATDLVSSIAPVVITKTTGAPPAGNHVVVWDLRQRPAQTISLITDLLEYRANGELWQNYPIPATPAGTQAQRTYLHHHGATPEIRLDNLLQMHSEPFDETPTAGTTYSYRVRWYENDNVVDTDTGTFVWPAASDGQSVAVTSFTPTSVSNLTIRGDIHRERDGRMFFVLWQTRSLSAAVAPALNAGYVRCEVWTDTQVRVPAVPARRNTQRIGAYSGWLLAWVPEPGDAATDHTRLRSSAGHNNIARPPSTSTIPAITQRHYLGLVTGGSVSFDILDQLWPYVQDDELGLRQSAGRVIVADVGVEFPGRTFVYDATRHGMTVTQANAQVRLYTNAEQTQGLLITLSDPMGAEGNEFTLIVVLGGSSSPGSPAAAAALDQGQKRLTVTIERDEEVSATKDAIDAVAGVSSAYFGGATADMDVPAGLSAIQAGTGTRFSGGRDAGRGYRSGDVVVIGPNIVLSDLAGGRISGVRYVRDVDFAQPPLPFKRFKTGTVYTAGDYVMLTAAERQGIQGGSLVAGVHYIQMEVGT